MLLYVRIPSRGSTTTPRGASTLCTWMDKRVGACRGSSESVRQGWHAGAVAVPVARYIASAPPP